MHKASLDSCALSLVEILEQTKVIIINPFSLEHNGHIKCGTRTPFQGLGGSWLFSPETGDTETLKKSPGTAERMASLVDAIQGFMVDAVILAFYANILLEIRGGHQI